VNIFGKLSRNLWASRSAVWEQFVLVTVSFRLCLVSEYPVWIMSNY